MRKATLQKAVLRKGRKIFATIEIAPGESRQFELMKADVLFQIRYLPDTAELNARIDRIGDIYLN